MRQFTADAAHELRTPLAVIRSAAELALRGERSPQYYQDCLEGVVEDADRLARLSNQLLMLAREDAGLNLPPAEYVDLSGLARGAAADLAPILEERGLTLECSAENESPVQGDADGLRRILFNLLDNAAKNTPADGRVRIAVASSGEMVALSVTDTGAGIGIEHLPRLGERFYRAEAARDRDSGGAGLGLAICRAILRRHGSELEIQSEPGAGTQVAFRLPRRGSNGQAPQNDPSPDSRIPVPLLG
jgi:signal transduction histidine kinase